MGSPDDRHRRGKYPPLWVLLLQSQPRAPESPVGRQVGGLGQLGRARSSAPSGPAPNFTDLSAFLPEGSRGMERTVVMDKSKGEPVISVKTTSRSKDRVSLVFAPAWHEDKVLGL